MSVRPNDGADVLFAKIQRADTVDIERRNWRWDFWVKLGTHRQSGGQFVRRLNEGRVALVRGARVWRLIARNTRRPLRKSSSAIWQPELPLPTINTAPGGSSSGLR